MLYNCQEITLEDNNGKKPKFTLVGQTHISENTRNYDRLPAIRPVIGTINTVHYIIAKYLFFCLTENNFTLNDLFETTNKIKAIYTQLHNVTSLVTNVPLNRTIKVILKRIYKNKVINTTLRNCTMKTLIIDACTKTALTFSNKICKLINI